MLLADSAQEVNGKLYVLGGGWSVINSGPGMFSVAVYLATVTGAMDGTNRESPARP